MSGDVIYPTGYGQVEQGNGFVYYPGILTDSFAGTVQYGQQTNNMQSSIATTPATSAGLVYFPQQVGGFGGTKDALLAPITSVTNQANPWGRIPRVYGTCKVYPVLGGLPYSDFAADNSSAIHAVYDFGHGPLDISAIRIDENPIATYTAPDPTGAVNFYYELHTGLASDGGFQYYTGERADTAVNAPIPPAGGGSSPLVLGQAARYADTLVVTLEFTAGLYQQVTTTTGGTTTTVNGVTTTTAGTTTTTNQPYSVNVQMTARPATGSVGGHSTSLNFPITANRTDAFRYNIVMNVPVGEYDVYIDYTQDIPVAGGVAVSDITYLNLTASQTGPSFRPLKSTNGQSIYCARMSAYAAPNSAIQGTIGNVSAICKSILASFYNAPSNISSASGMSAPITTANPADIVFDMLTGLSTYIPVTLDRIDYQSVKAWYDFCVSKSITFNKVYDSETTTYAAIQEVMTIGRAQMIMKGNKYAVLFDHPQTTVVQEFTDRNIIKDSFSALINYTQTPNCVNVTFLDQSSRGAWQQNIVQVFDDGFTVSNFQTYQDVTLVGCTDPTQAHNYGRYFLAQNRLRPITFQWQCDQEAIVCTQGDLVAVQTEIVGAGLASARISQVNGIITDGSGNVTGFNLDAPQQFVAGNSYVVRIRMHDGTMYNGTIVNPGAGMFKTIMLTSSIPAATAMKPQADDLVSIGLSPDAGRLMLITNIVYSDNLIATITAVDYAPGVYTAENAPIPPFTQNIQSQHPAQITVNPPIITSLQSDVSVAIRLSNGSFQPVIVVYVAPPANNVVDFEYQIRATGTNVWSSSHLVSAGGSFTIPGVIGGQKYDIQVQARNSDGFVSAWTQQLGYLCIGETIPPADPLPIIEDPVTGNLRLAAATYPIDFAGFRVKMNLGFNTNWDGATVIAKLINSSSFDISPYRAGQVTFLVKTVNAAGVESVNAATLQKGFGDVVLANVLADLPESPAFNGTKVGGTVIGGKLTATLIPSAFWTGNPNAKFYTGIPNNLFYNPKYPLMSYQFSVRVPSYVTKPSRLVLLTDISAESYQILYQPPTTLPFWNTAPNGGMSNFWANKAGTFWKAPANPFVTWPMVGVDVQLATYNFIIICQPSNYQTFITKLIAEIDTPTKTFTLSQIHITPTGTPLPVPPGTFQNQIDYVNLALVGDPQYPNGVRAQAQLPYGLQPKVMVFDSNNLPTDGTVDAVVGGY